MSIYRISFSVRYLHNLFFFLNLLFTVAPKGSSGEQFESFRRIISSFQPIFLSEKLVFLRMNEYSWFGKMNNISVQTNRFYVRTNNFTVPTTRIISVLTNRFSFEREFLKQIFRWTSKKDRGRHYPI